MLHDLNKAERHWQRRRLFGKRRQSRRWLLWLGLALVAALLVLWHPAAAARLWEHLLG